MRGEAKNNHATVFRMPGHDQRNERRRDPKPAQRCVGAHVEESEPEAGDQRQHRDTGAVDQRIRKQPIERRIAQDARVIGRRPVLAGAEEAGVKARVEQRADRYDSQVAEGQRGTGHEGALHSAMSAHRDAPRKSSSPPSTTNGCGAEAACSTG